MRDDLATRRRNSPITQARMVAFRILTKHPDCLQDDVPLDDLLEDIAQAIAGGSAYYAGLKLGERLAAERTSALGEKEPSR